MLVSDICSSQNKGFPIYYSLKDFCSIEKYREGYISPYTLTQDWILYYDINTFPKQTAA